MAEGMRSGTKRRSSVLRYAALALAITGAVGSDPVGAREGDLIARRPFARLSPQDIAHDETDGTFWITVFLDNEIYHYSPDLTEPLGSIDSPFQPVGFATGLAYNSRDDTLLVADALAETVIEIDKTGTPTGREITPEFLDGPSDRFLRGMSFDPNGDGGRGSFYVVEMLGTVIYEFSLTGERLQHFVHPDDPDGFPGDGGSTVSSDVEIVRDGAGDISGYYVTGGSGGNFLRRLNPSGEYEGTVLSLADSGGNVSGVLRRPHTVQAGEEPRDVFLAVVDSNADIAILEGGDPPHHEILDFACQTVDREIALAWRSFTTYDRIEVRQSCDVLATLPGDAREWRTPVEIDGVYSLHLVAFAGDDEFVAPTCTAVVGVGEVTSWATVEGELLVDATRFGENFLVTDARAKALLLFGSDFSLLGNVPFSEEFVGEDELVTGVAWAPPDRIYVANASASTIAELDDVGIALRVFDLALPDLAEEPEEGEEPEPDLGFVLGMTFDATGNGGEGSLWVVEIVEDVVFEVDLDGRVIRSFRHPYLEIEPAPTGLPDGISSGGISEVLERPGELWLSGGTFERRSQVHVFRVEKNSGRVVPGSEIRTAGVSALFGTSSLGFVAFRENERDEMLLVPRPGRRPRLARWTTTSPRAAVPTFVRAEQTSYTNDVRISYRPPPDVDRVELFRDCQKIADVDADSAFAIDADAPAGLHEYAVRGVRDGVPGDFERTSVHAGPGAVLQTGELFPLLSPQQVAVDPVDDSVYVVVNDPGSERDLLHLDRNFRSLGVRPTVVAEPWEIATLAVRPDGAGDRSFFFILWQQPVPFDLIGEEPFLLVEESSNGELVRELPFFPPRSEHGFVTYPTGLTWDPATDTFVYLARTSDLFVRATLAGETIETWPHPAPPFQNFVYNLGIAAAPERGTFFISGSGRHDRRVTKIMEMRPGGELTGEEIPLENVRSVVTGIALRGPDLVAVGRESGRAKAFRIKAFSELPPSFVRGDANDDGGVNLSDAIYTLEYLFQGGPVPACEDAADVNDDADLNLSDAVYLILHLFVSGAPPAAPYPDAGLDPTPDGVRCGT